MDITLFNTEGRKIETFTPADGNRVRLYTCGPTVYNRVHIGNLRSYINADILRRTLELVGYDVDYVMNITDVDDKTIRKTIEEYGANATVANLRELTTRYYEQFLADLKAVHVPTDKIRFVRVSDAVPAITQLIHKLLDAGYAYTAPDGSTYFSIQKYQEDFKNYGSLVGEQFLEGKQIGARVKVDEYDKDNLSDFALWKAHDADDAAIYWEDERLGKGRPGWHIECSAINAEAFGYTTTDLHTGGVDLIFPHHTNEIAQSVPAYANHSFVRHWVHSEHLLVSDTKMAKSLGNFFTLDDLVSRGRDPLALRYLVLTAHYRTKLNFTWESLDAADRALDNYTQHYERLRSKDAASESSTDDAKELMQTFSEALADDLATARALAVAQQTLKQPIGAQSQLELMEHYDRVLAVLPEKSKPIPDIVQRLVAAREDARRSKQFIQSDALRDEILALGFVVEDGPDGPVVIPR